jgi:hypothetical protein
MGNVMPHCPQRHPSREVPVTKSNCVERLTTKTSFVALALLMVLAMTSASCSKNSPPPPPPFQVPSVAKAKEALANLEMQDGNLTVESDIDADIPGFIGSLQQATALREYIINDGLDGLLEAARSPSDPKAQIYITISVGMPKLMSNITAILGPEKGQEKAQNSPAWRIVCNGTTQVMTTVGSRTTFTSGGMSGEGNPSIKPELDPLTWFQYDWIEFGVKDGMCEAVRMQNGRLPAENNAK